MIKSINVIFEDGTQKSIDVKVLKEPSDKVKNYHIGLPSYEKAEKIQLKDGKGVLRFSKNSKMYFEPAKKPTKKPAKIGKKSAVVNVQEKNEERFTQIENSQKQILELLKTALS